VERPCFAEVYCYHSNNTTGLDRFISGSEGIMPDTINVLALVVSKDSQVRKRFVELLKVPAQLCPDCTLKVEGKATLEKAHERGEEHFGHGDRRGILLVSDLLHFDAADSAASSGARELLDSFGERPFATIAVIEPANLLARPEAPADIDRAVSPSCTLAELQDVVKLCVLKLAYLSRPVRRQLVTDVEVREIANRTELLLYFKLRHLVYTPMAYLDRSVERGTNRLDIDWFDTRSIHVGAFEKREGGQQQLIGTARLIATEPLRSDHQEWARELARQDALLDNLVNRAVPAMLPVFQSQDLEVYFHRAYKENYLVGEISRVIVHPQYRGAGLSRRLLDKALALAEENELHDLFLECLPMHEQLYCQVGFHALPLHGKVYMVNRTMVVMHRPRVPGSSPLAEVLQGQNSR
jgi:predicted GNAT family N-acyltransferase